ncbi:MAG: hypothetical protein AB7N76_18540 [Planctomycetota bacterium]
MPPELLRCPSCGAPLEGGEADRATCAYCGAALTLGACPRASDPEAGPAGDYGERLAGAFLVLLALALGWVAVDLPVLCARGGGGELAVGYALVLGLSLLCLAATRRKLVGVLLALAGGLLLVSKPWAFPIIDHDGHAFSPTSETACYFLVPGGLLLALTGLVAISLRRADLRPRAPRWFHVLPCALGLVGAAALALQPTRAQVAREHAARVSALRASLQRALAASAAVPARAELDPRPLVSTRWDLPAGNVQFVHDELLTRTANRVYGYFGPGDALRELLRCADEVGPAPDYVHRKADAAFAAEVQRALAARYVCVYRLGRGEVEVFLVDVERGALVARGREPCEYPRSNPDRVVLALLARISNADVGG